MTTTSLRVARFIILKLVEIGGVILLFFSSYKLGVYVEKAFGLGLIQPITFGDKIALTVLGLFAIIVGIIVVGYTLFLLWLFIEKNWEWAG